MGLRIGPAAASLLRQYKLQAKQIKPSGPHGMVTKGDVLAAIEAGVKPTGAESSSQVCPEPHQKSALPCTLAYLAVCDVPAMPMQTIGLRRRG